MTEIRNRVKEMVLLRGRDLMAHDGNFRMHPEMQKRALAGRLQQAGITGALKAYYSERNGGQLTLVDGHCRAEDHPDTTWPVLILDLNDQEADEELMMGDTITTWAQTDPVKLNELVQKARVANAEIGVAIDRIRNSIRDQVEIAARLNGKGGVQDQKRNVSDAFDKRMTEQKDKSVKVVVSVGEHLPTIEQALKATRIRNRGEALAAVCQYFLDNVEEKKADGAK